ncbi:hypothetical protein GCM10027288_45100 [Bordetella tumbae]
MGGSYRRRRCTEFDSRGPDGLTIVGLPQGVFPERLLIWFVNMVLPAAYSYTTEIERCSVVGSSPTLASAVGSGRAHVERVTNKQVEY